MEIRMWRLEKTKLASNGNRTNKIPFLDVFADINLVGHVIKSHKALLEKGTHMKTSLWTGSDSSTAKRSAIGVSVTGVDHYEWMPRVKVDVARLRTLTAQWARVPCIGQNLTPFTGNGKVSICIKILEWDEKPEANKETNQLTFVTITLFVIIL